MRRAYAAQVKNGRLQLLDTETVMNNVTDIANCDANLDSKICQNLDEVTDTSNKDIYGTIDPDREAK